MKGTIKLNNAVMGLRGPLTEVSYDTELITVDDYIDAQGNIALSAATSPVAHLNLGIAAIARSTPDAPKEAIRSSLLGSDIVKVARIGADFTQALEDRDGGSSSGTSTDTPSDTTKHRAS